MSDPRRLTTYEFPKHTCGDGHKGVYYDQCEADAIIAALEAELAKHKLAHEKCHVVYLDQQAEIARLCIVAEKAKYLANGVICNWQDMEGQHAATAVLRAIDALSATSRALG